MATVWGPPEDVMQPQPLLLVQFNSTALSGAGHKTPGQERAVRHRLSLTQGSQLAGGQR